MRNRVHISEQPAGIDAPAAEARLRLAPLKKVDLSSTKGASCTTTRTEVCLPAGAGMRIYHDGLAEERWPVLCTLQE